MRKPLLAGLVALLLAAGCGAQDGTPEPDSAQSTAPQTLGSGKTSLPDRISTGEIPQPELETQPVVIEGSEGEVRVEAEIAADDATRTRGLMAREELGESEGMLFVFDEEQPLRFIMDNTLIPLSIAYIDSGGLIVDVEEMEPLSEETYPSDDPAQYALEVNQGFFEERDVEVGDEVDLP